MSNDSNNSTKSRIKIWQQNLGKSNTTQQEMLAAASPTEWDILTLQEPWINHLGNMHTNLKWNVVYPLPKGHDEQPPPRSTILVNTKFPTESISQIPLDSNDITTIRICTQHHTLTIVNIYKANDNNDTISTLSEAWEAQESQFLPAHNTELLLLGNFNRHHCTWEGNSNPHLTSPDQLLNPLLELVIKMRLEMTLPKGTPTLEARHSGRWMQPDNIWRNVDNASMIISYNVHNNI